MSPSLALEHPVFLTYLQVVVGVLAAAGGLLLAIQLLAKRSLGSIWATYKGWLIMAPLVLGAVFGGRLAVIVGVTLLGGFGFREFARSTALDKEPWHPRLVLLAIALVGAVTVMQDPTHHRPGWYGLFMALPVYGVAALLIVPIALNRPEGQLRNTALAILGFVYFGWMFGHLGFLANAGEQAYGYLLYLTFAVGLNDVAAFTFGKLFGKHGLRRQISPNKTVEGSLGALAVSMTLPWLVGFSFPQFGWAEKVLAGLIVGVGGQCGDLAISFIKRDLGIKDMGSAIPGHGGVLDRIDSLLFTAPLFFHMVRWFHGLD